VPEYFLGLDLGQAQDYTALVVLEAGYREDGTRAYNARHIHRWKLGTRYTQVATDLDALLRRPPNPEPPFDPPPLLGCTVAVDVTGVGRGVWETLQQARLPATLHGVVITGGHAESRGGEGHLHVPKKDLVSAAMVLLQNKRLGIVGNLALSETLAKELANFRVKITAAGNETFESWREREHDDLVLATALACWLAERAPWPDEGRPFVIGNRSVYPQGSTGYEHPPQVTGMGYMPLRSEGPGYRSLPDRP
jgi:hypothetical protein